MSRALGVAMVQHSAEPHSDDAAFAGELRRLTKQFPAQRLWVYPELHLASPLDEHTEDDLALPLDDPRFEEFGRLALELGIWLVPGTFYERGSDGNIYNTALIFDPTGNRVASYRKIFPWRPLEGTSPGNSFEVFELAGYGRVGFSICYDIWFPEHTRHLAWGGAELVLNLVQTGTSDREQEVAIVRGNAIMNQVWIASVNAAAPHGRGRSLLVDPEGTVRACAVDASPEVLTAIIDFAQVAQVRTLGTAGVSRPWSQMKDGDAPIELPLYRGRITPATWTPGSMGASA